MAQTPHQQIQVVQQQQQHPQMAAPQLQQVYFPQQQMLFPGNITLQQTGSTPGQATLQSILPSRSYSNMMPKAIQSSPVTVQSIGGTQRQLVPQITNQAVGTFQPGFISNGSFTTLAPLPVGYQWATSCYQQQPQQQQQSPIIIRGPHPGSIYLQSPQTTAIQLPMSAAGQQMVTQTAFSSSPQIQLETQTIATQTLVPSVTAVHSNNSYIQLDPSTAPSAVKSPLCNSPSSSTQDPPSGIAPQPPTSITPSVPDSVPPENTTPPAAPLIQFVPDLQAGGESEVKTPVIPEASSPVPGTVSSTTTPSVMEVEVSAAVQSETVNVGDYVCESAAGTESEEMEPETLKIDLQSLSPQKSKSAYLGPLKEKQPQKAIVKPQVVSQVKEEASESEGQESIIETLKPSSPKTSSSSSEPVPNLLLRMKEAENPPIGKLKVVRKRGRPRRIHGNYGHRDLGKHARMKLETENSGEVSKSGQASASQSSGTESMDAEVLSPDPNPSIAPMDIISVVEQKLKVDMPKTPPNTWTVDDVCNFVSNFPGCNDYTETFRSQEIDGQALLLIQLDHLMTGMCMKLGPAVKLIAHIRSMKEHAS